MILKITNDFNLILNENDYRDFVNAIDLLSLHCPVCCAVGLFILYGHYRRFVIIDDISNGECILLVPPSTKSTIVSTEATIEIKEIPDLSFLDLP